MSETEETASLSDRIAQALGTETSYADLTTLIQEAEAERQRLQDEVEHARRVSLSPRARSEIVLNAREAFEAWTFESERLVVAIAHLKRALTKAEEREVEADRQVRRKAAIEVRDAAAERLREYPDLANQIVAILREVEEAERLVADANRGAAARGDWLEGVEERVRGLKPNEIHKLAPLVRLPPLSAEDQRMNRMLWPVPVVHAIPIPAELTKHAAALGRESRRIGAEVAKRRQEEANSPRRRIG